MKTSDSAANNLHREPQKKKGAYFIIKGTQKQMGTFCVLYEMMNSTTKQRWHGKRIDQKAINDYKLQDCLMYNAEILDNCREMQNIIHMQEMFIKKDNMFIIQEQYDITLPEKVRKQYPLSKDAEDVLNEVLSGLVEIYGLGYATRSLQPQHIVCVDNVWKIQSFVYTDQEYYVESEYCWSRKFASPEDRARISELAGEMVDEQIVWNLGVIGLYMLLGPDFPYEKINDDSFVPWGDVESKSSQCLYKFLREALRVDFYQRLKLKDLLRHELFINAKLGNGNPFMSYDTFFGCETPANQIVLPLTNQDKKKLQQFRDRVERYRYFGEGERYAHELHFKNNFDVCLVRYLCSKIRFDNLLLLQDTITKQKRTNVALSRSQQLKKLQSSFYQDLQQFRSHKQTLLKNLQDLDSSKSEMPEPQNLPIEEICKETLDEGKLTQLFMKMSGCIYTELVKLISKAKEIESDGKQRTVCFYSLAVYLLWFYETDKFRQKESEGFVREDGTLELTKLIHDAPLKYLIELTQKLVKEHFRIVQTK